MPPLLSITLVTLIIIVVALGGTIIIRPKLTRRYKNSISPYLFKLENCIRFNQGLSEQKALKEKAETFEAKRFEMDEMEQAVYSSEMLVPEKPANLSKMLKILEKGYLPVIITGGEAFVREFWLTMKPRSMEEAASQAKDLLHQFATLRESTQEAFGSLVEQVKNAPELISDSLGEALNTNIADSFQDVFEFAIDAESFDMAAHVATGWFEANQSSVIDIPNTSELAINMMEISPDSFAGVEQVFEATTETTTNTGLEIAIHFPVITTLVSIKRELEIQKVSDKDEIHSLIHVVTDVGLTFTGGKLGVVVGTALGTLIPPVAPLLVILGAISGSMAGRGISDHIRLGRFKELRGQLLKGIEVFHSDVVELDIEIHEEFQSSSNEAISEFRNGIPNVPKIDNKLLSTIAMQLKIQAEKDIMTARKIFNNTIKEMQGNALNNNYLYRLIFTLSGYPPVEEIEEKRIEIETLLYKIEKQIPDEQKIRKHPLSAIKQFFNMPVLNNGNLILEMEKALQKMQLEYSDYDKKIGKWKLATIALWTDAHDKVVSRLQTMIQKYNKIKEKWKPKLESLRNAAHEEALRVGLLP